MFGEWVRMVAAQSLLLRGYIYFQNQIPPTCKHSSSKTMTIHTGAWCLSICLRTHCLAWPGWELTSTNWTHLNHLHASVFSELLRLQPCTPMFGRIRLWECVVYVWHVCDIYVWVGVMCMCHVWCGMCLMCIYGMYVMCMCGYAHQWVHMWRCL